MKGRVKIMTKEMFAVLLAGAICVTSSFALADDYIRISPNV